MLLYLLFSNIIDLTVLMLLNENWTELDDDIIFAELLFLDEINFNNWLFFSTEHSKAEMHHFPVITVKLLWNGLYSIKRYIF